MSELTLFPVGTMIHQPDADNAITIDFPAAEDAIVFFEFLRGFANHEFSLEITECDD